jgi:HAD superfamily hydrolase (TIGR01509 family)
VSRQKFKYIFWDNDGVLVDTEGLYLQACRESLTQVGIKLSDQQFLSISLTAGKSVFDLANQHGVTDKTIAELRRWRDERYAEILGQEEIVPLSGVPETLQTLHGQIGMSIVTSSQQKHFEIIHADTGLLIYFEFCLTRKDYKHSKPSPEPYLLATNKSKQRPEDVLVIEDSPRGLAAAKAAGLTCWVIPGEHTKETDFLKADRILSSAAELPELIL